MMAKETISIALTFTDLQTLESALRRGISRSKTPAVYYKVSEALRGFERSRAARRFDGEVMHTALPVWEAVEA